MQRDGHGNNAPTTEISLSDDVFQAFLTKLNQLNLTSLRHEYVAKDDISDGCEWLYVQYGTQMQAFSSHAYEVFPEGLNGLDNLLAELVHPDESEEEKYYRRFEPENYEWFLRMTNKRKYEEYLQSKTPDKNE